MRKGRVWGGIITSKTNIKGIGKPIPFIMNNSVGF